jgi:Fe-S cluster assembly protein SufD
VEEYKTDHSNAQLAGAHSHGVAAPPVGSRAERLTSFSLDDIPIPTGREEEWRFTPVHKFDELFQTYADPNAIELSVSEPGAFLLENNVPATDPRFGKAGKPGDRTAVTAWHAADKGSIITLPAKKHISEHLMVQVAGRSQEHPSALKLLVRAETGSSGVVVIDHTGVAQLNETIEIDVEAGAHLTVVSVQDWERSAVHASSHRAILGEGATLKHVVVTFGGDAVRITPDAAFVGKDAAVEMIGLYFADAGQHLEHRLFVDHGQPNCVSRVTYKGALQGQDAHAVWVGDVLIQANAVDTDTYEMNRNLILTKGARADSVPNLEIETGEIIGAGHASATGRFDDEQLFYLMARGIPEKEARLLVVRGFFAELVGQIGVPEVEARLLASIEEELVRSIGEAA